MYVIHGAIVKYNQLYKIAVITLCLWGAFPSSIALFPQTGSISAQSVEPEFQAIKDLNGEEIQQFFYNKGV